MICGRNSSRIWSVLLLLLLVSWPMYSDENAADSREDSETEECESLLSECVNRLETTTNELERSMNRESEWRNYAMTLSPLLRESMSLNSELQTDREADVKRFDAIEDSLSEFEKEARRNWWRGGAVGALIGIVGGIIIVQ